MVADYWDPHEGWKWSLINEYLPEEWPKRIASFEVTQNAKNDDQLVWDDHCNGGFTLRSAMKIIRGRDPEDTQPLWMLIWRSPLPQRMRFFLWLVGHDQLMTNHHRFTRGLANDSICKGCLSGDETFIHLLRDCKLAKEIWNQLVPTR